MSLASSTGFSEKPRRALQTESGNLGRQTIRRALQSSTAGAPTRVRPSATRGVEGARRQMEALSMQRSAAEIDSTSNAIDKASRQLAGKPTRGPQDLDDVEAMNARAIESATRHLEMLKGNTRGMGSVASTKPTRGGIEAECELKVAALKDLRTLHENGGVVANFDHQRGILKMTNGIDSKTYGLDFVEDMIKHATHGCIEGDTELLPCAVCANKF